LRRKQSLLPRAGLWTLEGLLKDYCLLAPLHCVVTDVSPGELQGLLEAFPGRLARCLSVTAMTAWVSGGHAPLGCAVAGANMQDEKGEGQGSAALAHVELPDHY